MKRSKLITLIVLLIISTTGFSIENSPINDTLLYFEFDIRSNTNNSIVVSGLSKNFDYSKLSKASLDGFIASFYKQGHFVPSFLVYDEVINECAKITGDSTLIRYVGQGQKLMNLIAGNEQEIEIVLETGETVFVKITEVSGTFLHFSKGNIKFPSLSNEPSLDGIEEILNIYVPVEITSYKTLSRKCVKEMFMSE